MFIDRSIGTEVQCHMRKRRSESETGVVICWYQRHLLYQTTIKPTITRTTPPQPPQPSRPRLGNRGRQLVESNPLSSPSPQHINLLLTTFVVCIYSVHFGTRGALRIIRVSFRWFTAKQCVWTKSSQPGSLMVRVSNLALPWTTTTSHHNDHTRNQKVKIILKWDPNTNMTDCIGLKRQPHWSTKTLQDLWFPGKKIIL